MFSTKHLKSGVKIIPILILGFIFLSQILLSCGKPKTEQELYTLAQNAGEKGEWKEAVKIYQKILRTYPKSSNCHKAMFMIGFIYSEQLKDYKKAKEVFQKMIEKYPNCDLSDDAKFMMENMGKEPAVKETNP